MRPLPITINPPTCYNVIPPFNTTLCPHSVHGYAPTMDRGCLFDFIHAEGV